ncbi:receptor-like protein 7 [Manihot esculenta]|uniref:receptor-like protein 7 n=1 Tax=Manihot esculenta TaxID=3983 RepID=UPI000B5D45AA|nr:receptor-like protein 7 [Manihot esculenta]
MGTGNTTYTPQDNHRTTELSDNEVTTFLGLADESLALLQFKNSFNISSSYSYSKLESWKLNQGVRLGECCLWYGVECDEKTNHVVSLDLSESCIYGSINSNSTHFRLVHLQRLNLGSNDFIHSQIPSEIGQLSRLTHLNLSFSGFSSEIPDEISNLSSLVSLDLSRNLDFISYDGLLKLRKTSFRGLVQNMTNLKELDLEYVDISSTVPKVLANLSSLESLHLCGCELHGEFSTSIFWLPNLKIIDLCENINLTGFFPDFQPRSHLERLRLFSTSFYGKLVRALYNGYKWPPSVLESFRIGFLKPYPVSQLLAEPTWLGISRPFFK